MGILGLFSKGPPPKLERLPAGSFTMDRGGKVLASTLPQAFPAEKIQEIGQAALTAFHEAKEAGLPFTEIIINYAGLKITAREQRGGAMIFLAPRSIT